MAETKFTRCLLELPKVSVNDIRMIVRASISGKNRATNEISVRAHCYRSMKKLKPPHQLKGVKPGPVDAMVVVKPKPGATSASGIRSTLYKGYSGELPDPSTLNPLPAYADMEPDSLPLICRMNITSDKPLVDSIFGKCCHPSGCTTVSKSATGRLPSTTNRVFIRHHDGSRKAAPQFSVCDFDTVTPD
ncbi:unnamed protein product [Leuciscus chuanchicus]